MTGSRWQISYLVLTCLMVFGLQTVALAQDGEHRGHHVRGRITAIAGNSISIEMRGGNLATILTTESTTFVRDGEAATLEDFEEGDGIKARGRRNEEGNFVAAAVHGRSERPEPPADGSRVGGEVVGVDVGAGTLTINTRDGATVVIYTTPETSIVRNRQPATLADFEVGDRLRARGERDPDGSFVAERILGGSGRQQ